MSLWIRTNEKPSTWLGYLFVWEVNMGAAKIEKLTMQDVQPNLVAAWYIEDNNLRSERLLPR